MSSYVNHLCYSVVVANKVSVALTSRQIKHIICSTNGHVHHIAVDSTNPIVHQWIEAQCNPHQATIDGQSYPYTLEENWNIEVY